MFPEADPYDINLFEEGIQEDRIEVFVSSMAMMQETWHREDVLTQIPSWWPNFHVEFRKEPSRDGVTYILTRVDDGSGRGFEFSGPQNTVDVPFGGIVSADRVDASLMRSNAIGNALIADLVVDSVKMKAK